MPAQMSALSRKDRLVIFSSQAGRRSSARATPAAIGINAQVPNTTTVMVKDPSHIEIPASLVSPTRCAPSAAARAESPTLPTPTKATEAASNAMPCLRPSFAISQKNNHR